MNFYTVRSRHEILIPMTLCYVEQCNQILLGIKQQKIGAGVLTAAGGKIEPGETAANAAVRECYDESMVTPSITRKMAELRIYQPNWNILIHVYHSNSFSGVPEDTDEMKEWSWYPTNNLPWERMWPTDHYWLARALSGQFIYAYFVLDSNGSALDVCVAPKPPS
jgi:ADP-ribose pyrophosphatase YjhB (NUDIX family)